MGFPLTPHIQRDVVCEYIIMPMGHQKDTNIKSADSDQLYANDFLQWGIWGYTNSTHFEPLPRRRETTQREKHV